MILQVTQDWQRAVDPENDCRRLWLEGSRRYFS
jgi:hypothetical protein